MDKINGLSTAELRAMKFIKRNLNICVSSPFSWGIYGTSDITVRNFTSLPALRFLGICNALHTYNMGVSGPSLLIESTNSMVMEGTL